MEDTVTAAVLENAYRTALGGEPAEADLTGGGYLLKSYGKLWFSPWARGEGRLEEPVPVELNVLESCGRMELAAGDHRLILRIRDKEPGFSVENLRKKGIIALDADRCLPENPLVFRNRRPGDRFRPVGMRGSKKLQDHLVDRKIPRHRRDSMLLLAAGNRILLAGVEAAGDCAVTQDTRRILEISGLQAS